MRRYVSSLLSLHPLLATVRGIAEPIRLIRMLLVCDLMAPAVLSFSLFLAVLVQVQVCIWISLVAAFVLVVVAGLLLLH